MLRKRKLGDQGVMSVAEISAVFNEDISHLCRTVEVPAEVEEIPAS